MRLASLLLALATVPAARAAPAGSAERGLDLLHELKADVDELEMPLDVERGDKASNIRFDNYIMAMAFGDRKRRGGVAWRQHLLDESDKFALVAAKKEPCEQGQQRCVGGEGIKSVMAMGWTPNLPTYWPTYDAGAPIDKKKRKDPKSKRENTALGKAALDGIVNEDGDHTSMGNDPAHGVPTPDDGIDPTCKLSVSVITANMELNPNPTVTGVADLIQGGITSVCEQESFPAGYPNGHSPFGEMHSSLAEAVAASDARLSFVDGSRNAHDGRTKAKCQTRSGLVVSSGIQAEVVHTSYMNIGMNLGGTKVMLHTTVDVAKLGCAPRRLIFACAHMPVTPNKAHFTTQHKKIMSKVRRSRDAEHTGGARAVAAAFWSGDFNTRPDAAKVERAVAEWATDRVDACIPRGLAQALPDECDAGRLAALMALYADSKKGDKLAISKHRKAGNAAANGWLDRVLYCANPNPASKECEDGQYKITMVADYNIPLKTAPHFALAGSDHLPVMVKYEVKDKAWAYEIPNPARTRAARLAALHEDEELEERNDYIDYELPEDENSLEKVPTKTKAGGAVKKARATSARARRGRRGRVANTLDPSA